MKKRGEFHAHKIAIDGPITVTINITTGIITCAHTNSEPLFDQIKGFDDWLVIKTFIHFPFFFTKHLENSIES